MTTSHVALEVANQTRPNMLLLSEEVEANAWTLLNVVNHVVRPAPRLSRFWGSRCWHQPDPSILLERGNRDCPNPLLWLFGNLLQG